MSFSYVFLETAQTEYEVSLNWYLERSLFAAEQFIASIEHAINLICNHPHRWRNEYKRYFELSLKKYPFSVVYTIDEEAKLVYIVSIYHHSRNPKSKYKG